MCCMYKLVGNVEVRCLACLFAYTCVRAAYTNSDNTKCVSVGVSPALFDGIQTKFLEVPRCVDDIRMNLRSDSD